MTHRSQNSTLLLKRRWKGTQRKSREWVSFFTASALELNQGWAIDRSLTWLRHKSKESWTWAGSCEDSDNIQLRFWVYLVPARLNWSLRWVSLPLVTAQSLLNSQMTLPAVSKSVIKRLGQWNQIVLWSKCSRVRIKSTGEYCNYLKSGISYKRSTKSQLKQRRRRRSR